MCHGFSYRDESTDEIEQEEPEFLNEESSAETELVTDGGDEDEE
ncbi:MAG: hypothetical protein ACOCZD_01810 [Haloferacaceae archaeon]